MRTRLLALLLVGGFAAFHAESGWAQVQIYVSPQGNDAWSGTLSAPNSAGTDGPKRTLTGGRDAVRRFKMGRSSGSSRMSSAVILRNRSVGTKSGYVVNVAPGEYSITDSLQLNSSDNGTGPNSRVIFRSTVPQGAILQGGKRVTNWQYQGPAWWQSNEPRVDPNVRANIVMADLPSQGITDLGRMSHRKTGYNAPWDGMSYANNNNNRNFAAELTVDGVAMTLARWPNRDETVAGTGPHHVRHSGWNFIRGKGPNYNDSGAWQSWNLEAITDVTGMKTPPTITSADDVWLRGCMTQSRFYEIWEKVAGFNVTGGTQNALMRIDQVNYLHPDEGQRKIIYEPTDPGRFYLCNSIWELDQPGEYYVDRINRRVYMYPPASFSISNSKTYLSMANDPIVQMSGTNFVDLQGFRIENGRGMGVLMTSAQTSRVLNCFITNMGLDGVRIMDGRSNAVMQCRIMDPGETGVHVEAGERSTLTWANHVVEDNYISGFSRTLSFYRPGIVLDGCGNFARQNTIENSTGNAILYFGNDLFIERNEISRVCTDSGDDGAIVSSHDHSYQGNVIRGNYFHDIQPLPYGNWPNSAIFWDGASSGNLCEGNVFERVYTGVNSVPSFDNRILRNAFIDCYWGAHAAYSDYSSIGTDYRTRINQMPWQNSQWRSRYPKLYEWMQNPTSGQRWFTVNDNVFFRCDANIPGPWQLIFPLWGNTKDGNLEATVSPFNNAASGDFTLRSGANQGNLANGYTGLHTSAIGVQTQGVKPVSGSQGP